MFTHLRQAIDKKESELMMNIDELLKENAGHIDASLKAVAEKSKTVQNQLQGISRTFATQDKVISQ